MPLCCICFPILDGEHRQHFLICSHQRPAIFLLVPSIHKAGDPLESIGWTIDIDNKAYR